MIPAVNEILRQTETLTSDEQLALAAMLIQQARNKTIPQVKHRKWLELMGAAPYPLMDGDAQDWVTRTRQEGDDKREQQWSHEK